METEFPAKVELAHFNTVTKSETCGAFGEMELSLESSNPNSSLADARKNNESMVRYREEDKFLPKQHRTIDIGDDDELPGMVYKTTTVAPSESSGRSGSRRAYGKIVEVYSNSGDTVDFARNMTHVVTGFVSPFVWIAIFSVICVYAISMITFGALHFTHCSINNMIPVYLIVAGIFYIIECSIRIYSSWPVPHQQANKSLISEIIRKGTELLVLIFLLVWLILGCVWIYGARANVHFKEHMFEPQYCDYELFWFAWWSVTLNLILIALGLLVAIGFVFVGVFKENDGRVLK
uniref:Uncharacterized protein n=1 Tax=Plectus sambesii TaxID=2011161 RepID=A0A914W604_9BILA